MKTLIVDDEINGRETLALLIDQHCPELQLVGMASNLEEAESLILNMAPTLVFLDIKIGTQTIFELLNKLPRIHFEIIFITAYENYAIDAIRFMAIDYLLKPVDISQLKEAVHRASVNYQKKNSQLQLQTLMDNLQQKDNSRHRIALATTDSYEFVLVEDILYCIAEGSYTRFVLVNEGERFVSRHLKYYEKLLTGYQFFRSHQSCLLNLKHINKILRTDGGTVQMADGKQLPIARNKKQELMDLLSLN
ncbi:LytR/AlgR family response regulator transcription factor [Flavobacteriaceae bacterium M23B6Z8]